MKQNLFLNGIFRKAAALTLAALFSIAGCDSPQKPSTGGGGTDSTDPDAGSTSTVSAPSANPPGGAFTEVISVTLTCSTEGAVIYYTVDGSLPTSSSAKYSEAIPVAETTTIKAFAIKDGMKNSVMKENVYTIELPPQQVAKPVANPGGGVFQEAKNVQLSCATDGAVIHYTEDGTIPTESSPVYSTPIAVTATKTIKAIGVKEGLGNSSLLGVTYTINIAAPPASTPVAAPEDDTVTYTTEIDVNLLVGSESPIIPANPDDPPDPDEAGPYIYYTLDGTPPGTNSTLYRGDIHLTETTVLKAVTVQKDHSNSVVLVKNYTIEIPRVAKPVASTAGGSYTAVQTVELSCATPGASIYYTDTGATPDETCFPYTTPLTISQNTTIKAIAMILPNHDIRDSEIMSESYLISVSRVSTPAANPQAGVLNAFLTNNVTLTCSTANAEIRYTLDGTEPTASSDSYTAGNPIDKARINGNITTTLKAKAFPPAGSSLIASGTLTAVYTFKAATPTSSKPAGNTGVDLTNVILTSTPGASIYYTTDGAEPTDASTLYASPFTITTPGANSPNTGGDKTVKAIAKCAGMQDSDVLTAAYTFKVANPVPKVHGAAKYVDFLAHPGDGVKRTVYLESPAYIKFVPTDGAAVRFIARADANTPGVPNQSSGTISTDTAYQLSANKNFRIRAIAYKNGFANSDVPEFYYWIATYSVKCPEASTAITANGVTAKITKLTLERSNDPSSTWSLVVNPGETKTEQYFNTKITASVELTGAAVMGGDFKVNVKSTRSGNALDTSNTGTTFNTNVPNFSAGAEKTVPASQGQSFTSSPHTETFVFYLSKNANADDITLSFYFNRYTNLKKSFNTGDDTVGNSGEVTNTIAAIRDYLKNKTPEQIETENIIKVGDYLDLPALNVTEYTRSGAAAPAGANTESGAVTVTYSPPNSYNVTSTTPSAYNSRISRLVVAGINSFAGKNGNGTNNHIVFQFQNGIARHRMDAPQSGTANSYETSELREYLVPVAGATGSGKFLAGLTAANTGITESVIWAPKRIVNGKDGLVEITDKVWIPNEWEMTGSTNYKAPNLSAETELNQGVLQYYATPQLLFKYNVGSGNNPPVSYWFATYVPSFATYASCYAYNASGYIYAKADMGTGVVNYIAPAFCIEQDL